jgi:cell division transport system permease protein
MKTPKPRKLKKRVFRSWLTTMVSISLVLLMLGALLIVLTNAGRLSDYVREQVGFTLALHDGIKETEVSQLQKAIESTDYVKSVRYIDKETAARELTADLGEDFTEFLGFNPLFASMDVKLFASYTHSDSLLIVEKEFLKHPQVKEVYYQKDLLAVINDNVRKISLFLLVVSALTGFIFISLINNTIRISIYSERFTINTMQLVGATRAFVRKPFLRRGLSLGILGSLIANALLFAAVFSLRKELGGIIDPTDMVVFGPVFLLVIVLGMTISWISTRAVVNKFLKMKFDELFY